MPSNFNRPSANSCVIAVSPTASVNDHFARLPRLIQIDAPFSSRSTRNGRQGRLADHLTRMNFIILDELGYLPFGQSGGSSYYTSSAVSTSEPR